jgi:cellulose synthase (UDP-forming)
VTPKGSGNEDSAFDLYTFACVSVLIAATALGLFINIVPEWSRIGQGDFSVVSVYWALVNIAVLVIAALICFEKAKPLQDSFDADETAYLTAGGRRTAVRLVSISLDRATLEWPPGAPPPPADVLLEMSGVEPLPARIAAAPIARPSEACRLVASFELVGLARNQGIVKLYTDAYSQDVRELDKSAIAGSLLTRAFGSSRPVR